jgi:hypothetical protein
MSTDDVQDLIDLYAADELPEGLQRTVETSLRLDPELQQEIQQLRAAVERLKSAPLARPDGWYVDRLLGRVLQDFSQEENTLKTVTGY